MYAFELDLERIGELVTDLRPAFERASNELEVFAAFLDGLAREG